MLSLLKYLRSLQRQQDEATEGLVRRVWGWIKGQTVEDVARLREAGVQLVEGEAATKVNQAKKLEAEARKAHAEADAIEQDTATKRLLLQIELRELNKNNLDDSGQVLNAVERVELSMSRIRQDGGSIAFDSDQLSKLLPEHQEETQDGE